MCDNIVIKVIIYRHKNYDGRQKKVSDLFFSPLCLRKVQNLVPKISIYEKVLKMFIRAKNKKSSNQIHFPSAYIYIFQLMISTTTYRILEFIPLLP